MAGLLGGLGARIARGMASWRAPRWGDPRPEGDVSGDPGVRVGDIVEIEPAQRRLALVSPDGRHEELDIAEGVPLGGLRAGMRVAVKLEPQGGVHRVTSIVVPVP
jgi:hypothetical protein